MNRVSAALLDLKQCDLMASGTSPVHRLHPLTKVLTTLIFILCIVSFQRYELTALFPYFVFPLVMAARSSLPLLFITHKIILLLPFILLAGMFNPMFDRSPLVQIGSLAVSGGWISFFSIITRFLLTVSCALILIGTTGFLPVCQALRRLGIPQIFTNQLQFLYRYIFVLAEEAGRISLARELRSCGTRGQGIESYSSLIGALLLRTWERAERIHGAMLARAFNGEFHNSRSRSFERSDIVFLTGWSAFLIFIRFINIPVVIGDFVTRFFT